MSERPQSPPYVLSLRWKFAVVFLLLLGSIYSLLSWHLHERLTEQFYLRQQVARQHYIQLLSDMLKRSEQTLINVAATVVPWAQPAGAERSEYLPPFGNLPAERWHHLSQTWQLEALQVFNQHAQSVSIKGGPVDQEKVARWVKQLSAGRAALTDLVCEKRCLQYAAVPVTMAPEVTGVTIIATDIRHVLESFRSATGVSIGILQEAYSSPSNAALPEWQANVISLAEADENLPVLRRAAQYWNARDLLQQTRTLVSDQQMFALSLVQVPWPDLRDTRFVLLEDVSLEAQWLQRRFAEYIALSAVASLLLALFLLAYTWRYISGIKQLATLLPLLGQKQFHKVRERIRANQRQRIFSDELDILDGAATTLSYQLESLEKAVGVHNEEMERLSLFDPLTGLANRNLFQYEVQRDAGRIPHEDALLAVVLLDLDKFKRINDSLGHQQGDLLLRKIGERLKKAARTLGLVARLGGDEFAVLVRRVKSPHQIETLSRHIVELVHKPIMLHYNSVVVSCSLGVSLAKQSESANDLIKHAEIAMYKAKDSGGNTFRIFDTVMATEAHNILSLEGEIRRALENEEFTLYLQPKVNMNSEVEGFESLVRWDHPDRGILPPAEFIPAMEKIGIISELDNWVLEASCRQLKVWKELYPSISLAVNISSIHFTDKNFLLFLQKCLQKYPIDPGLLELEITETLLMENMNEGLEIIHHIKQLGVRIAIDDFGTGYSSLSYLKKLPVDTLKIDREFIKDIPDSTSDMQISSIIIFLARQLKFKVVAEGVETSEQLVFLKANQCDLAQGYYFSEPIPAHKAMIILESQSQKLGGAQKDRNHG